ncbi:MAG: hypothetical protein AcusKO_07500 [Acuticoccus sp.]
MWRFVLAVSAAIATIFHVGPDPAQAQGRIVAKHGDWQIRCEQPVGSPSEQCALIQNVEAQDRQNVGLTVIFLRTADRQARILRVLAPLGVLLPSGLGLSIDDNEVGLAGFVRCLPEGCIAEVELDDGLLERFGAGDTATFVIFQTPEEGIGVPISLSGFNEGFAALDNPPPPPAAGDTSEPAAPSAVSTTVTMPDSDRFAAAERSFNIPDDRSELDRLLEDPLFPYVAASAVLLLAVVIIIILAIRGRGRRRREERYARYDDEDDDYEYEPRRGRDTGRGRDHDRRYDDEDDGLDALDHAPRGGRRSSSSGGGRRLAADPRPRQLPKMDDGGGDPDRTPTPTRRRR